LKAEGGVLPSVTDYDYPINKAVRGTNDRTFRFAEVCSESQYLYKERTVNGDLNVFTGNLSGAPITVSGGTRTSTSFSGWQAYGDLVWGVPNTGMTIPSGMSGMSEDTTFRSIAGAMSVGMLNRWTGDPTYSGVAIFQSGIALSGKRSVNSHQFYLQYKLASGDSSKANAQAWIEGYTGEFNKERAINGLSTIAVYYPTTGYKGWNTGRPPHNNLTGTSAVQEYIFDFTCTGFPSDVEPDAYNVMLTTSGAGNLILFDECHVDQYMKKNAFSDVVLPSGYMIQMTPDLGWHDTLAMFGERDGTPNPHLVNLGPYTMTSGMADNKDGTVSVTLSQREMERGTSKNYRKYLWRAIATSENGVEGGKGFPRRFTYMGRVFDEEFSVNTVMNELIINDFSITFSLNLATPVYSLV